MNEKSLRHNPLSDPDTILKEDFYGRRPGPVATSEFDQPGGAHEARSGAAGFGQQAPRGATLVAPEPVAHPPAAEPQQTRGRRARRASKPKPTHYKVICISMYTKDIENLEAKVAELKRRGHTKANKSQLIRMALNQVDLDKIPLPQP